MNDEEAKLAYDGAKLFKFDPEMSAAAGFAPLVSSFMKKHGIELLSYHRILLVTTGNGSRTSTGSQLR